MKKEYKELFSTVVPSEEIKDKVLNRAVGKKKPVFSAKKIVAAVAAFAVIAGGSFGIYRIYSARSAGSEYSQHFSAPSDFSIVAYAQNNREEVVTIQDEDFELMNIKITLNHGSDGYSVSGSSEDNGITVRADEDIESVTFECENGSFTYTDSLLKTYRVKQQKYYSAVIPITEQQYNEYNELIAESGGEKTSKLKQDFVSKLIRSKDCSAYIYDENFDVNKISTYEYSCYSSDMAGEDENGYEYCILIVDKEKNQDIMQTNQKKVVAKTYQPGDEIGYVNYWPDKAMEYLLNYPDMSFDKLPTDVIKITVQFENGQSVSKEIVTSFDSDGTLKMKCR